MVFLDSDSGSGTCLEAYCSELLLLSSDYHIQKAFSSPTGVKDDRIGRTCYEYLSSLNAPCPDCGMKTAMTDKCIRYCHSLNAPKNVSRLLAPFFKNNDFQGMIIVELSGSKGDDKQVIAEVEDSFLKNLIMSSVDGVIASDMRGRILIFNQAASQILGYREDDLAQLSIRNIYPAGEALNVMRELRGENYGGKGKLRSYRTECLCKDGSTVPINLSAAIVYQNGREAATVGFFYDLREKIRIEKELMETQIQLMQAEKMTALGMLSAGVAHQLNNPLSSIIIFSRLLLEEPDMKPNLKDDLLRILEDANRCQQIVRELLVFARPSFHGFQEADINQALARAAFLLESQGQLGEIEIVKELDPDLPLITCDIQRLNHVFMNIIINAVDSMTDRGRLTIRTLNSVRPGWIRVEISDTGPGISGDVLPRIFEPFYTTKEEGKGTGLGLSMAYSIVKSHGGWIMACSAPGEGATFVIELPRDAQQGKE